MKKQASTNSQTTISEILPAEKAVAEAFLEQKEEPKPDSSSIKAVRFLIPQNFVNQGQLGTVSSNMEWLTLRADFGIGVFYRTPGVWVEGRGQSKFRVFVPEHAIGQIEYEKQAPSEE